MRQKKCDISSIHIKTPQKKILAVQEKKRGKKKMLAVQKKFFGTFVFAKKKGHYQTKKNGDIRHTKFTLHHKNTSGVISRLIQI